MPLFSCVGFLSAVVACYKLDVVNHTPFFRIPFTECTSGTGGDCVSIVSDIFANKMPAEGHQCRSEGEVGQVAKRKKSGAEESPRRGGRLQR